ncbi:MAG: polysaccharide biosynthesis tyrosine autokinase [Muribaculaceae bacterium]|nr:polysaccharide biosynthesis tyrosine autokinase [Muribaculaceae bacterium]
MEKEKEKIVDFGAAMARYKRHWLLFAIATALCLGGALFYLHIKPDAYLIESTVMVADKDNNTGASSLLKSLSLGTGGSKVDDEVVVMGSQELCVKMIEQLKLNRRYYEKTGFMTKIDHYNDSPIELEAPVEFFDTLMTTLNVKVVVDKQGKALVQLRKGLFGVTTEKKDVTFPYNFATPYGIFNLHTTEHFKLGKPLTLTILVSGNTPRAEQLREIMTVTTKSKKSNAIYMDVVDPVIDRGKDMLNTLVKLYNERGELEKNEQAINTGNFIDERIALIYNDLAGSEAQIEDYKRRHDIADVEMQTKALITRQQMADNSVVALETKYRIVSMIKDFMNDPRNRNNYVPFDIDSTAATSPLKAYNALIIERSKLEASATGNNQQLQQIDNQIAAMRANVLTGVDNTLRALRVQIDRASSLSSSSLNQMDRLPVHEREMRTLYRQQGIQNALYTFLLQKREENQLLLAATTPKGQVVDHAFAHTKPVYPNKFMVLLIGLLLGLTIPILLLYLKRLLTTKFATQEELETLVTVPVLGEVSHNRHNTQLVVEPQKTSGIVELFRLLRNNLQFMLTGKDDKVIVVTSSVAGEGKSFISANLAASFALLDKRVALVGMDIRNPRLAEMLDLGDTPGVTSFLASEDINFDSLVQHVEGSPNLDVIVAGPVPPNPSELLLGDRATTFFDELRARYDIVIIDSAPIAMVSDTFSVDAKADATLFVTRAGFTKRNQLKYFNSVVERGQLKNVAVVLNDTKSRNSQGYGYGYGKED